MNIQKNAVRLATSGAMAAAAGLALAAPASAMLVPGDPPGTYTPPPDTGLDGEQLALGALGGAAVAGAGYAAAVVLRRGTRRTAGQH
ncbi:MAG TPA: hypothetical protein VFZ64_02050 [Nocardioidaceae bacterium]